VFTKEQQNYKNLTKNEFMGLIITIRFSIIFLKFQIKNI